MARIALSHFRRFDWLLFGCIAALMAWSVITIWGLAIHGVVAASFFWRQLAFALAAVLLMVAASFFNYRIFREHGKAVALLYVAGLLALAGLFVFGTTVRGTRGWYAIAGFGLSPVEFFKIILLVLLAKFFSVRHRDTYQLRSILASFVYVGIPAALVFLEPDFGSAAVLALLWLSIIVAMGLRPKQLVGLLVIVACISGIAWTSVLKPYQKTRLYTLLDPMRDPRGSGYQLNQSTVAVGSGGFWGKGIGQGTQIRLHFLPEVVTDFIFSAIAEEWGLAGVLVFFTITGLILWRVFRVAMRAENNFGRIFALGFGLVLFIHFFLNVGMNAGLVPVVGLPLPFMSYGGSHILAFAVGAGLIESILVHSRLVPFPAHHHHETTYTVS